MAGIALPKWHTLKGNITTILRAVAAEEALVDAGRNFAVSNSRWRPWIESQQGLALVNVMVDGVESGGNGAGSRRYKQDVVRVNIDMYALGTYEEQAGELTPADEVAGKRLDLLTAQVRSGITRMINQDLGFEAGTIDTSGIDATLTMYSQEREESSGMYAPARWSFAVQLPYLPEESPVGDLDVMDLDLQQFAVRFVYSP